MDFECSRGRNKYFQCEIMGNNWILHILHRSEDAFRVKTMLYKDVLGIGNIFILVP